MNDKDFIDKLKENAGETVTLLSNAKKSERERMVVRAYLRCIGVAHSDDEIRAWECEPIDVRFRCASFQIMAIIGDRKLHADWRNRERLYGNAKNVSDLLEPWVSSKPTSMKEISETIVNELKKKAAKYGAERCASLDALVYVNLLDRHLYPPESDSSCHEQLISQGWRSVSMLWCPYGHVLITRETAPEFLRDCSGSVLNKWKCGDGLFDPD